jgi:hypothetical protein
MNLLMLSSISILLLLSMFPLIVKNNLLELKIAQAIPASNMSHPFNKHLLVALSVNRPIVIPGSNQTLEFTVTDNETGLPVNGAHITGVTMYINPHGVPFDIFSDPVGKASFTWKIPNFAAPGVDIVNARIEAKDYTPAYAHTYFQVR